MSDPLTIMQAVIAGVDFGIKQGTDTIRYLKRKHGHVKNIRQNYDKLMKEYEILCTQEIDIKIRLERNKIELDEKMDNILWLKSVEMLKYDVKELMNENRNRPSGPTHYYYLMKLGKRIVRKTQELVFLKNYGETIPNIMVEKSPVPHTSNPTNKISEFPPVKEAVKKPRNYYFN